MKVKALPYSEENIEKLKDIAEKQTKAIFNEGVETGLELVIDFLEKTVVDYEASELKKAMEDMLEFQREYTREARLALEQISGEEDRIIN